eukprot:744166-Hanusia_phi.AAC.1
MRAGPGAEKRAANENDRLLRFSSRCRALRDPRSGGQARGELRAACRWGMSDCRSCGRSTQACATRAAACSLSGSRT